MNREVDTWSAWTSAAPTVHRWEGEAFVWLLEFWATTDLEVPGLGHKIVEGSGGEHRRRGLRVRFALPWACRAIVTAWACKRKEEKWPRT